MPNALAFTTVLVDVDGTLIDSNAAHAETLRDQLRALHMAGSPDEVISGPAEAPLAGIE